MSDINTYPPTYNEMVKFLMYLGRSDGRALLSHEQACEVAFALYSNPSLVQRFAEDFPPVRHFD